MFWKFARAPVSLTGRIAALYTLLGGTLFVMLVVALYWVLLTVLEQEDGAFVRARLNDLRAQLESTELRAVVLQEIRLRHAGHATPGQYFRVLGPQGQVLAQTPGMEPQLQRALTLGVPSAQAVGGLEPTRLGERRYLLAAAVIAGADGPWTVQMAMDTSRDDLLLRRIREYLVAATLLSVAATAAVGWWVARRGLRPLGEIARAAAQISAHQLHSKLVPEQWPSELRGLASEFDLMLQRLQDSFDRLTRFSADLAHELRTPIHNLRGEAEVALLRARDAVEYRLVIESALEEYDRLGRLIQGLLFLARAEHHELHAQPQWVGLADEFAALVRHFQVLADERGVMLHAAATTTRLHADPMLLRRLLSNLVSNALDHTPRGGSVTLRLSGATVEVADTGNGIAPEHLPHIFERFYRARAERAATLDGSTGLGLAIARSIMRLHGGEITVTSQVGAGTVFRLEFAAQAIVG